MKEGRKNYICSSQCQAGQMSHSMPFEACLLSVPRSLCRVLDLGLGFRVYILGFLVPPGAQGPARHGARHPGGHQGCPTQSQFQI